METSGMKTELFTPVISLMNFVSSTRVYEVVFCHKKDENLSTVYFSFKIRHGGILTVL